MKRIILLIIAVLMLAGCAPTTGSPEDSEQALNNTKPDEQGAFTHQTNIPQDAQPTDDPGNFLPPQDDNLDNPKDISELRAILEKSVGVIRSDKWMVADEPEDAAMEMPSTQSDMSDSVKKTVSDTNVQVEGVDEMDTLKNDGDYLYYCVDNRVYIIDIRQQTPLLAARINPKMNHINGIYLLDDTLIVIGGSNTYMEYGVGSRRWNAYRDETQIMYYDVKDRQKPSLVTSNSIEGWYQTSRLTNHKLYVIVNKYAQLFEDDTIPVTPMVDGEPLELDCVGVLPVDRHDQYMTIASVNVQNPEQIQVQSFLGSSGTVYANKQHIYIASPNHYSSDDKMRTDIHKLAYEGLGLVYKGVGSVGGHPLNQFSMDEYDGNFRIAVTQYDYKHDTTSNDVYILNEEMETVGKLEGLAPGEHIYSARFQGDRAYLVTFKTVDPLFVIDVSDPASPKELGYLKIPGYSNYLHVWKDGLVLGIGKDTFEKDDMAYYKGVKIALFDVSDVNKPIEKATYYLGDRGTESDALHDHTKLMVNAAEGFIGLSANVFELPENLKEDERAYGEFLHNGWYIFDITDDAITERGHVLHNGGVRYEDYVQRAAYTGDTLYTISSYEIIASNLQTLHKKSSLEFR